MKTLSVTDCKKWVEARAHVMPSQHHGFPKLSEFSYQKIEYQHPVDSGKKIWLARLLSQNFAPEAEILIWFNNWQVWPSSGHLPLLTRCRQALGEHATLEDAPGHLLKGSDTDDAASLLFIALSFYWDCFALGASGGTAVYISHDEYWAFLAKDGEIVSEIKNMIETPLSS